MTPNRKFMYFCLDLQSYIEVEDLGEFLITNSGVTIMEVEVCADRFSSPQDYSPATRIYMRDSGSNLHTLSVSGSEIVVSGQALATLVATGPAGPAGANDVSLYPGGGVAINKEDTNIYQIRNKIIFDGTNTVGTPTTIKAVVQGTHTNATIRIYDAVNFKEICQMSFNKSVPSIIDLGTISNVPTEETVLEIQVKGGGAVTCHSISFRF